MSGAVGLTFGQSIWSSETTRPEARMPSSAGPRLRYISASLPKQREVVRPKARELRARPALLLRRWATWWRIVRSWRGTPVEQRFLALCAYCGHVRVPGGEWEEIPRAVARRFHIDSDPQVTHGVCPDCFAKLEASGSDQLHPA
jgi:hypothetical protein